MRSFRYLLDPLFLTASAGYLLNRWLLKPALPVRFFQDHFNDTLLIPAALPVVLWIQRNLGLRSHDASPTANEVFSHLAVWSLLCEFIAPHYLHLGKGDLWDVLAYATGGLAAWRWWNGSAPVSGGGADLS